MTELQALESDADLPEAAWEHDLKDSPVAWYIAYRTKQGGF